MGSSATTSKEQTGVAVAVLALGAFMAWGASDIPSEAGYAGVGPNFLPWVVAVALMVCGVALLLGARQPGGWSKLEKPSGADAGDWPAFAWVAAGIISNALLIQRIGFILSCALCFVLAVRGLRLSLGKPGGAWGQVLRDALIGIALAAPTFWLFTKILAVKLPGLTSTGWI